MKTKIKRKQRGSVLLTVLFVMSILIVFLVGTLALSIATNDRAHVNYSTAQTSVTARSVAESVITSLSEIGDEDAIQARRDFTKAVAQLTAGQSMHVPVTLSGTGTDTMGSVDDVEISYAGTKKYYDVDTKKWETRDLLKFTATVTMSGVTSTSSVYVLKHYATDNEGTSGGGAGFVTTASASLATQANIWGGSYVSLPTLDNAQKYVYRDDNVADLLIGTDIATGGRNFGSDNKSGLVLQNSGGWAEADFYVNNNVYLENWNGFIFPRKQTGITVLGNLVLKEDNATGLQFIYKGSKTNLNFNEVPYLYVDGVLKGDGEKNTYQLGNPTDPFPFNVFCGHMQLGYTDTSKVDQGNATSVTANIYCMDIDQTSYIRGNKNDPFHIWTESVVTNAKTAADKTVVKGEICSNGNLQLMNCYVQGDVRVRGDLTLVFDEAHAEDCGVRIGGDLVVGGNIKVKFKDDEITDKNEIIKILNGDHEYNNNKCKFLDLGGHIYCDNADLDYTRTSNFVTAKGELSIYPEYAKRQVILGLDPNYKLTKPTDAQKDGMANGSLNREDYDYDENGELTNRGKEKLSYKVVKTLEDVLTSVADPHKDGELPSAIQTIYDNLTKKWNGETVITESCIIDKSINASSLTANELTIRPGSDNIVIVFKGDNLSTDNMKDIVIDDTGVNKTGNVYFIVDKDSSFTLSNGNIITQTYLDAFKNNTKFRYDTTSVDSGSIDDYVDIALLNGCTADNPYVPRVFIYGLDNSKFNATSYAFITANIVSAKLAGKIDTTGGSNLQRYIPKTFYYNNVDVKGATGITGGDQYPLLLGRLNAESVEVANQMHIIYVSSGKKKSGGGGGYGDDYWWKPLYASEF